MWKNIFGCITPCFKLPDKLSIIIITCDYSKYFQACITERTNLIVNILASRDPAHSILKRCALKPTQKLLYR